MNPSQTPADSPATGQQPAVAPPTGPNPVVPGLDAAHPAPAAEPAEEPSEFRGATLREIAALLGNLGDIVPAGLIAEVRSFANTLTLWDVEIHAVSAEAGARICQLLPWRPVQHVQPGHSYDHYCHDGILWDLRVRVVGLERLPTGPIVLPAGSTPTGWGVTVAGTDQAGAVR